MALDALAILRIRRSQIVLLKAERVVLTIGRRTDEGSGLQPVCT